jgi:immune inhibitor A
MKCEEDKVKKKFFVGAVMLAMLSSLIVGVGPTAAPQTAKIPATEMAAHGQWMSLVPPRVDPEEFGPEVLVEVDPSGAPTYTPPSSSQLWARKHHLGPNPRAAKALAKAESEAILKNRNPAAEKREVEYAKLLTLLIEFSDTAVDTFVDWERQTDITDPTCVVETVTFSGPTHGQLPDPATVGTGRDNNTFWVPDFNVQHFEKLMFSEEGITERIRTDLTGPDGQPGIDISGYTLRNYFLENSGGLYDLSGTVVDWLTLPHSEAWYGADSCEAGNASDLGHPDNPIGVQQSVVDAVDVLNAREPDFPWDEFDTDDDGVVDHLVIVHAGVGEEGGGGAEGTYSIWSHSADVMPALGGYLACESGTPGCDPDHDIRVQNYIMQPEDAGVGVFAHEYGHDLGLPDIYDVLDVGESDVEFWDIMNTGSHSGPIFQAIPANFGIWEKWVLGWVDPVIMDTADQPRTIKIGQTSNPPFGSADGVRINLPDQTAILSVPHSGANMWWSNNDANWADYRLGHDFDLAGAAAPIFTFWTDYTIEELWDYAFVEVSTDGGMTWDQLPDMDGITTNDDPNGRLVDYGGLQNGITGDSGGWIQLRFDLSAYAGSAIKLRFRLATDAAFVERGMFVDDVAIDAIGYADDFESGDGGWVNDAQAFVGSPGAGWMMTTGTFIFPHFYLAEWRNLDGFDLGLKYTYDSTFLRFDTGEWLVERVPYNAPGMLVWYRNTRYPINDVNNHSFDPPSLGAKGMLLIVDSHFEPLRYIIGTGGCVLCNLQSRPQASNAAFNTWGTYAFQVGFEESDGTIVLSPIEAQAPVDTFTDDLGWVPGIEVRLDLPGLFYFRDQDASVVVPSVGGADYDWRIVWPDGSPATDFYGFGWGSGNPIDGLTAGEYDPNVPNVGVELGTQVEIVNVANDNTWVTVHIWNSHTTPTSRGNK